MLIITNFSPIHIKINKNNKYNRCILPNATNNTNNSHLLNIQIFSPVVKITSTIQLINYNLWVRYKKMKINKQMISLWEKISLESINNLNKLRSKYPSILSVKIKIKLCWLGIFSVEIWLNIFQCYPINIWLSWKMIQIHTATTNGSISTSTTKIFHMEIKS
jgi:hypothetical protein